MAPPPYRAARHWAQASIAHSGHTRLGARSGSGAGRLVSFSAADLHLTDVTAWRVLRQTLDYRHEARRRQLRFRRDP